MHSTDAANKLIKKMRPLFFLLIVMCISCGKEKSIQLPEINHSKIDSLKDTSTAYLFYNEREKDCVELNWKNPKKSTNWLVSVDKRLVLRQAIPSIQWLQEQKLNAKLPNKQTYGNYLSCNDISTNELGFIDFTQVVYHYGIDQNIVENQTFYDLPSLAERNHILSILFKANDSISLNSAHTTKAKFVERLRFMDSIQDKIMGIVYLKFHESLTFQDYITYKSMLSNVKLKHATISNDEYIFN